MSLDSQDSDQPILVIAPFHNWAEQAKIEGVVPEAAKFVRNLRGFKNPTIYLIDGHVYPKPGHWRETSEHASRLAAAGLARVFRVWRASASRLGN